MTETSPTNAYAADGKGRDIDGHSIDGATDEIFARAQEAVREVADRATHLAQETLERGRTGLRKAERSNSGRRSGRDGRDGASKIATALAVGALGYAIAILVQGASRKRHPTAPTTLPTPPPA